MKIVMSHYIPLKSFGRIDRSPTILCQNRSVKKKERLAPSFDGYRTATGKKEGNLNF